MKESQIISNNSNGGYFFLRTNTFSFQKQTKVSRYIIARHVSYNRLTTTLSGLFSTLRLVCFVGTNHILNASQQRYKSRTTTELQKYISVNGPNYVVLW